MIRVKCGIYRLIVVTLSIHPYCDTARAPKMWPVMLLAGERK